MSYTKNFTGVQGAWLKVADGAAACFVQLKDDGPLLVHVGQAVPGASSEEAAELSKEGLMEVTITDMEVGDLVHIRSRHDEDNLVVVIAPGTAPV